MTFPEPPEDDRHRAPADTLSLSDRVFTQRVRVILGQIDMDRKREEQYLGSLICKLRLLNTV